MKRQGSFEKIRSAKVFRKLLLGMVLGNVLPNAVPDLAPLAESDTHTFSSVFSHIFQLTAAHGAEFGEKPLSEEQKKQLDLQIQRLGDPSAKVREHAQAEILKFGVPAISTLKQALEHSDLTVAESANYCLQFLQQGWILLDDSPLVKEIFEKYQPRTEIWRGSLILQLGSLPPEISLRPLLRIVLNEKNALNSRTAALAVMKTLPQIQPLPQWPELVPEEKKFPSQEYWTKRNEAALKKQQELLVQIRAYLNEEPSESEGKKFLLELLELEQYLAGFRGNPPAAQSPEYAEMRKNVLKVRNQILAEFKKSPNIQNSTFLKETICTLCTMLYQVGLNDEAQILLDKQMNFCAMYRCGTKKDDRPATILHRFTLIQQLLIQGHREWGISELKVLLSDMKPTEKAQLFSSLLNILRNAGQFSDALTLTRDLRRLLFLDPDQEINEQKNSADQDSLGLHTQISILLAQEACQEKDYVKAKEFLQKSFSKESEIDVDALILARKVAIFTKDEEWLKEIEEAIEKDLDETRIQIAKYHQNPDLYDFSEALLCNRFAWLAANTERNLDEAEKYALRALEIRQNAPGIMDTLAHVYFAQGEFQKAFQKQKEAIEFGSEDLELYRNLERFRVYLPLEKQFEIIF